MLSIQTLAQYNGKKFVKFEETYAENSVNKTLSGVPETCRHVVAMRNPLANVFFINCISKTIVSFWNEIWLCEKTQTFCNCFHNYPLIEAGFGSWTDIVNFDIINGSPAGRRGQSRLVTNDAYEISFFTSIVFLTAFFSLTSITFCFLCIHDWRLTCWKKG